MRLNALHMPAAMPAWIKRKNGTNKRLICWCNWTLSLAVFSRSSSSCRSISSTWYLSLYCINSASNVQQICTVNTQHSNQMCRRKTRVFPSLDGVSETLCLLHHVTETSHLHSLRDVWRHFCLSRAAVHSDCCFFMPCTNIFTYFLTITTSTTGIHKVCRLTQKITRYEHHVEKHSLLQLKCTWSSLSPKVNQPFYKYHPKPNKCPTSFGKKPHRRIVTPRLILIQSNTRFLRPTIPDESALQTASQLFQPFLHSSPMWPKYRQRHRQTTLYAESVAIGHILGDAVQKFNFSALFFQAPLYHRHIYWLSNPIQCDVTGTGIPLWPHLK